jgi:hypothetical protein
MCKNILKRLAKLFRKGKYSYFVRKILFNRVFIFLSFFYSLFFFKKKTEVLPFIRIEGEQIQAITTLETKKRTKDAQRTKQTSRGSFGEEIEHEGNNKAKNNTLMTKLSPTRLPDK